MKQVVASEFSLIRGTRAVRKFINIISGLGGDLNSAFSHHIRCFVCGFLYQLNGSHGYADCSICN